MAHQGPALAKAMAKRLPNGRIDNMARMFGRALILRVYDCGYLPEREELMRDIMMNRHQWLHWSRTLERSGMLKRGYGWIDFSDEVLAEAINATNATKTDI